MAEQIQIRIELLEQFERGNVLLFIGERINRDAEGRAIIDRLAAQLTTRCDVPAEDKLTFPQAAQVYEYEKGPQALVQFLRDRWEEFGNEPQQAHRLIADLTDCNLLVTTCVDRRLERAFEDAGRSLNVIIGSVDVAFEGKRKARLYKLCGSLERPEALVLTEDDYETFFDDRSSISIVLQSYLARKTILFLGYHLDDPHFKRLYRKVTAPLDDYARLAYAFDETLSWRVCQWCKRHGIEVVEADATAFLEALIERLAARARPKPAPRPVVPTAEPLPLPEEPYKALVAYEARDRALFFGRDREIEELTALIHAQRLVLLYGASGVGKTSLLQAGVIPRLEEADPGYSVVNVRALTDPAGAIRAALRRKLPEAELPEGETSLVDFLAAAACAIDRPLVVVMDQFEEFFRLSPEFRAAFIAELGALYDARGVPVKVVLSLRGDYLYRVSEVEARIPEIFQTRMSLLPLTREQACAAIVCPVEPLGYAYEPELVERLLEKLPDRSRSAGTAVMPPHLQLVCSALFRHARRAGRKTLTLADYETLGGVQGVLRDYLDRELRRFPPEEQALARDLLEELVTSERTKKVETLDKLAVALGAEPAVLSAIAEKLVRARLLRPVGRVDATETAYELASEYLIAEIELSPEAVARKEARRLLRRGVDNWRRFDFLIDSDGFSLLDAHREEMPLTREEATFMLQCSIRHNVEIDYWVSRLEVEDVVGIVRDVIAEREVWVKQQDRVNALYAANCLPSQAREPLLYEQAVKEGQLAQQARSFLQTQGSENAAEYFHKAWITGTTAEEREKAILVLSELNSRAATEALEQILDTESQEARIKIVETIGKARPSHAQVLLAEVAICDESEAVRESAQRYLHKAPGGVTARRVFELAVPSYANYVEFLQRAWTNSKQAASQYSRARRMISFVLRFFRALSRADLLQHNRALVVSQQHLGIDAMDCLVEALNKELAQRPSLLERLAGMVFLIPLLVVALLFPSLPNVLLWSVACILSVTPLLVVLLVACSGKPRTRDRSRVVIWQEIKDILTECRNYLLPQSIGILFALLGWFCAMLLPVFSDKSTAFEVVRTVLLVARAIVIILYLTFSVCVGWHFLKESSSRNISWFIAGPGESIRWYTARELVRCLNLKALVSSLDRLVRRPDSEFPLEVVGFVSNRVHSDKEHRKTLGTAIKAMVKREFQTTDNPKNWYVTGTMLKGYGKSEKELVKRTAQEQAQQLDSPLSPTAKMLLRSLQPVPKSLTAVWSFLKWAIALLVVLLCIFLYLSEPRQEIWTIYLSESSTDTLWIGGESGLYRFTLEGEDNGAHSDPVVKSVGVQAGTCAPAGSPCFVSIDEQIGIVAENVVEWLDCPGWMTEIEAMWAAKDEEGAIRLWVQGGSYLAVSTDMGATWSQPFNSLVIEELVPLGGNRAVFAATRTDSEGVRHIMYATSDSGKTWKEIQETQSSYFWLKVELQTIDQPSYFVLPDTSRQQSSISGQGSYYLLSAPSKPAILLHSAENNELWYSAQGVVWKKAFVPEESLGEQACGAWFSQPKFDVYDETTLLYRSYGLLNGEQGIYLSWDLGETWQRIIIDGPTARKSALSHWHPSCGDAWR